MEDSLTLLEIIATYFIIEGIIKPFFANWGKRAINRLLPKLYILTDKTVLQLINEKDEQKIKTFIKDKILFLDPDLSTEKVEEIYTEWDKNYSLISGVKQSRNI